MEDALSAYESTRPVTGEELLRMPWLNPCELVGGRIVRMTPTNPTHGRIEVNVAAALGAFVRTHNPHLRRGRSSGVRAAGGRGLRVGER